MVALTWAEQALINDLHQRGEISRDVLTTLSPEYAGAAADLVRDGLARWHRRDGGEYLSLSETDERTT